MINDIDPIDGSIVKRRCNGQCVDGLFQEEYHWGSGARGQGPRGSPSPGDTASPGGQLERTPSFTAEWEEVREAALWLLFSQIEMLCLELKQRRNDLTWSIKTWSIFCESVLHN